jgi:two-component system phosphate regulon sensor histidine kinase PhoR
LGLAIVKHIVQAHGGTVRAESELGLGTTFRFTIPSVPDKQRSEEISLPVPLSEAKIKTL